jgi:hypothetical protein
MKGSVWENSFQNMDQPGINGNGPHAQNLLVDPAFDVTLWASDPSSTAHFQEGKELSKLRDIEQRLAPLVASLHLVHFIPEVPDIPQPALLSDVFCLRRRFHVQLGNRLDICMVTSTDDFILSQLITSRIHSSLMQSI